VENGFYVGDVVLLGVAAPPEYRHRRAVVMHVQRNHCTVCVLDDSGRSAIGECWPGFEDLKLASRTLRLGVRVVIDGCSGPKTQLLNGHTGIIVSHKQGHPCFIHKGRQNNGPQLNVCVRLEQPPKMFQHSVLIEPRFLVAYEERVHEATSQLGDVVRTISQKAPGTMLLPRQMEGRKQVSPMRVSVSDTTASFRSRDSSPSLGGSDSSPSSGAASSLQEDLEPRMPVPGLSDGMLFDRTPLHAVEAKRPAELADCGGHDFLEQLPFGLPVDSPETFLVLATRAEWLAELTRPGDRGFAKGGTAHSLICCEQTAPDLSKYENCTREGLVESFARRGKCLNGCCSSCCNYFLQFPWAWFVVRLMVMFAWLVRMEPSKAGCLAALYVGSLFCQWLHFLACRRLQY